MTRDYLEKAALMLGRERIAQWMVARGYATGHGDTIEDMLKELEWQAKERGVKEAQCKRPLF